MNTPAPKLQSGRVALLSSDGRLTFCPGSVGCQGSTWACPLLVQPHNLWPKVFRGRNLSNGLGSVGDTASPWNTSRQERGFWGGPEGAPICQLPLLMSTKHCLSTWHHFTPDAMACLTSGCLPSWPRARPAPATPPAHRGPNAPSSFQAPGSLEGLLLSSPSLPSPSLHHLGHVCSPPGHSIRSQCSPPYF